MKKQLRICKSVTFILFVIIFICVTSMTVFADGTYTFPSNSQSGNNNSILRYYLTDENAGDITINFYLESYVELTLTMDDGWYFEKWETYFNGYKDRYLLSDPEVKGTNPVSDDGRYTFYNRGETYEPYVNDPGTGRKYIVIQTGTSYYGDHEITAVLKPIVTVNASEGVTYVLTTNSPTNVSANQTAVKYQDDVTITYTVDEKYVVTDVNASGTKTIKIDKANSSVVLSDTEKPTSVGIHARLKQQNVNFDANGGEGTMVAQIFYHSTAQELAKNEFAKTGYIFDGWNTKADGSGVSYADNESVTFTPENDGDSITLYAQWTECSNHVWEDGKCTKCATVCSHSGGTATTTEQAICEICGEKYGELLEYLIGDVDEDGVVNIFDATEIQLYLAKYKTLSETQMLAADADRDGSVTIFDVTQIQLYLAKYIPEL